MQILTRLESKRPTFFTKNNEHIRAGGVIFRKYNSLGEELWLMQRYYKNPKKRSRRIYADLGGKTDEEDTCILDTIIRECREETNGIITGAEFKNNVESNNHDKTPDCTIYLKDSRYLLIFMKASDVLKNTDVKDFGDSEVDSEVDSEPHSKVVNVVKWKRPRTMCWVKPEHVCSNFHIRLKYIKKKLQTNGLTTFIMDK